jgi:Yip1 domain
MMPMSATPSSSSTTSASTSLVAKLIDMFASPSEVFDEVVAARPRFANWLVPTVLVALASLFLLRASSNEAASVTTTPQAVEAQPTASDSAAVQAGPSSVDAQRLSALATCGGAFAGTFWSAFLLWFIGRAFLRTRFSYLKTVEVVALAGIIVALGTIVTALLIGISGDPATRPALSFFARHLPATSPVRLILDLLNFFHLWTIIVLAIGLSRLSGVSFKESAFWVFGYWLVARLALILLA